MEYKYCKNDNFEDYASGRVLYSAEDIPYGNLVDWNSDSENPLKDMLQQLVAISHRDTVLAVSMDKKQSIEHPA